MDEFEALMETPTSRRARRAVRDTEAALRDHQLKAEVRAAAGGHTKIPEDDFLMPVSLGFLARVMRMESATVKDRLREGGCKPVGHGQGGHPLYMFHEAVPYFVKPKMDISTYIKTLNPGDLPNSINKTFWEAERIKNKTLIETGEAWPTERVLDVLGNVFMLIRDRMPLILLGMQDEGISDLQGKKLEEYCDQFLADLHSALVDMPKRGQTYSRQIDIDIGQPPPADGETPE